MKSALFIAALLAGCATGGRYTQVYDKDGKPAHLIECGARLPLCHQRAQEICGGPYAALDTSSSTIGVSGAYGGTTMVPQHALTFRCQ